MMLGLLLQIITWQIIVVNQTTPCFLNETAGIQLWRNCGADEDYIQWALQPWEWITGGYFSLAIVSIIIIITYLKYHKMAYPLLIGIMFLPFSYFLFPAVFLSWAFILGFMGAFMLLYYAFTRQTKEW